MKINIQVLNERIKDTYISVEKHPTEDLYIYGYSKKPFSKLTVKWDEYTMLCRGLIINGEGEVIERPFPKFWTFRNHVSQNILQLSENRITKIPATPPRIFEKLDGTMGILYWIKDTPYIATQRSFSSLKADKASRMIQTKYAEAVQKLDRRYTYIFEVIYPEVSLVTNYGDREDLVLIGVIDKETGASIETWDKYDFPYKKDLTNEYGHVQNLSDLETLDLHNMEGLVLEYDRSLRIKIKFPWYKAVHTELQAIIDSEFRKFMSIRKLKEYYAVDSKPLSSDDIFQAIAAGDKDLVKLKERISIEQIDNGVLQWIEKHKVNYLKGEANYPTELFSETPLGINLSDDRMWEWKGRYLKYFYD